MSKNNQAGFSMIELMTVIAIVAILVALAVPSFNDYFEKARLRGAADAVTAMMSIARAEAVKSDRSVAVAVGGTAADWCVGANLAAAPASAGAPLLDAVACDCTAANECSLGGVASVVAGSEFRGVSVGATGVTVSFDPKLGTLDISDMGGFSEPSVTMNSSSGRFGLQVTVSALGHVRACTPSGKPRISGYRGC